MHKHSPSSNATQARRKLPAVFACGVFAYLTCAATAAAEPAAAPTAAAAGATLAQIDAALPAMQRLVADMPRLAGNPGPDHTGRRIEEDIARIVLQESALQKMAQLRARLPDAIAAGSDRVPVAALQPLAELHATELCRIVLLASYWQVSGKRDYHRNLMREQIERQPAAEQAAWLTEMRAIDQRAYSHQQRAVTLDGNDCAEPKFRARMQYEDEAVIADYNALRMRIADEEFAARQASGMQPAMTARGTPCPAAVGTTGKADPALHSVPDLTNFFPDPLRRPGVEGTARVAIDVDSSGCVTAAGIAGPSGATLLDEAGIRVAFEMRFKPGEVQGRPVGGSYAVPIRFHLPGPGEVRAAPAQPQP